MPAMKLLHCADLHLGRVFHERPLIEDQAAVLSRLAAILADGDYAALVVAGDIYDRSIPSPEATSLLGGFLQTLRERCRGLKVFLSPGNHDSAERLGYAGLLFASLNIHIASQVDAAFCPVIAEHGGERYAFFQLPFLTPGSLFATGADGEKWYPRSQRELLAIAAERLDAARKAALAGGADGCVLAAHLFTSGGRDSPSERAFLGTAERVDLDGFADFDYIALGHLHRTQQAAAKAWYSGSPLAYSFDEADQSKGCLSVELHPSRPPVIEIVEIPPLRSVRRRSGAFADFNAPNAFPELREAYLELSLDDQELVENPLALLRQRFPFLLSVKQDEALSGRYGSAAGPAGIAADRPQRGARDDFIDFLTELYGKADLNKISLFDELMLEANNATA